MALDTALTFGADEEPRKLRERDGAGVSSAGAHEHVALQHLAGGGRRATGDQRLHLKELQVCIVAERDADAAGIVRCTDDLRPERRRAVN